MGRKAALSEAQVKEIRKKALDGAPYRVLAREYSVSEAAIRRHVSKSVDKIKAVANQVVTAENSLKSLDIASQCDVMDYASKLRAIGSNLLDAAFNGSVVGVRMSAIAAGLSERVDKKNPMESAEELQAISALTKITNDSTANALALAKLTAEQAAAMGNGKSAGRRPVAVTLRVQDAS